MIICTCDWFASESAQGVTQKEEKREREREKIERKRESNGTKRKKTTNFI